MVLAALLVLAAVSEGRAGGALLVNGAGDPVIWRVDPVPYNPDRGKLGKLSNEEALARLATSAAAWTNVPTATVTLAAGAQLPVDVSVGNYPEYLFNCEDGLSPIVFDSDGGITDDLFGAGARAHIIGFAAPACGTYLPPATITQGYSVMNGRFLDGVSASGNPELTPQQFEAVLTHELGHYLGLDHSQINVSEAFDGNQANDDTVATMFPILINGDQMRTLNLDDEVAISVLYPTASFGTDFGTITGTIFRADGVLFQGAHVVARALADPRHAAIGYVSGNHFRPGFAGGPPDPAWLGQYELTGLPPGDYTVEVEPIDPNFIGGSSVGPLDIPAPLPGVPEFWNDLDEASANPPDDPNVAVPISVAGGATVSAIDITLNQGPPPPNDECADATEIPALPFSDVLDTTGATQGAFDPLQSCTPQTIAQNSNSVWYRFTAPGDGVVHASTAGSTYDTLVGVLTGACGTLVEAACADDAGGSVQASLDVRVSTGGVYYVEVTGFRSGGGSMHLALSFTPDAACAPAPVAGCRAPIAPRASSLRVKLGDPSHQSLQWKWTRGAATTPAEYGDPTIATGTSYALCLYDGGPSLVAEAHIPAAGLCGTGAKPCWRATSKGWVYKDSFAATDGMKTITLKGGAAGSASIIVKGFGTALDVPPLPAAPPLTMQLVNSAGLCWDASYPLSGVRKNDGLQLIAKGD